MTIQINHQQKLLDSRLTRLTILLAGWLVIRETSIRANGFNDGPIICPIRLLTGFPCPACGTTRSIGAFSTGDFDLAWSLNPLGFALIATILIWTLRIKVVNRFFSDSLGRFSKKNKAYKTSILVFIYGASWALAVYRFNSDTF
jgi:hypothetical protein